MSRGMTARQRWTALWSSRRSGGRLSSAAGGRVLRGRVCCCLLCRKNLWGTWNVQNGWKILSFYTQICNLCSLPGNIIFVILGPTKYLSDNFVVQACTDDFKVKCMGRDYCFLQWQFSSQFSFIPCCSCCDVSGAGGAGGCCCCDCGGEFNDKLLSCVSSLIFMAGFCKCFAVSWKKITWIKHVCMYRSVSTYDFFLHWKSIHWAI